MSYTVRPVLPITRIARVHIPFTMQTQKQKKGKEHAIK